MRKSLLIAIAASIIGIGFAQPNDSPSWRDFAQKRTSGNWGTGTLTDFSFAGYAFGNKSLPNTSGWNVVRVKDHGATPDDGREDNDGIQRAINAAQNSNQPSIVLFESGRYVINQNQVETIIVSKSNIVLRGTGSGSGGTEIFCKKDWTPQGNPHGNPAVGDWAFYIRASGSTPKLSNITKEVKRGSFKITVANSSQINVGQTIIIKQENKNNLAPNNADYPSTSLTNQWTRSNEKGLATHEIHVVKSKSGNVITLENPVLLNLPQLSTTDVLELKPLKNIGVESIRFSGNWTSYGETFIHHKANDHTHDQGWSGVLFEKVTDSWVTNCEFKDWNEAVEFSQTAAMSITNCKFTGKRAHATFAAKQSTGLLFENIDDNQNSLHGPGWQISACGIVCTHYDLTKDQAVDLHAANPYANLFDDMNGVFDQNGGSISNYPNAGPYNTFWNFVHDSNDGNKTLNFWDLNSRKLWTFANPVFVGLTSTKNIPTLRNTGKNESHGSKVYPPSLFDAQYQLRTYGGYMSASNTKSGREAVRANDDSFNTAWETNTNNIANQWLMLDFGTPKTINKIFIDERSNSIGDYKIQHWNSGWKTLKSGNGIGSEKTINFPSTELTVIRVLVENKKSGSSESNIKINTFGLNAIVSNENNPPTITLTSPKDGDVFELGTAISFAADASDSDGSIDRINFKLDDSFYKQDSDVPYEVSFDPTTVGSYVLSARAIDNDGDFAETTPITVSIVEQNPYGGNPTVIPGTLEAEHYDEGGQGVSYSDNDPENKGASQSNFRTNEGVDIGTGNGGNTLGWTTENEWLEYTVDVQQAGAYDMNLEVSSLNGGGELVAEFNGANATTIAIPSTGAWDNYTTVSQEIALNEGIQILKLSIIQNGFNVDKIEFVKMIETGTDGLIKNSELVVFPNPSVDGLFHLSNATKWEVIDLSGLTLLTGDSKDINLVDFAPGIYFLRAQDQVVKLIHE